MIQYEFRSITRRSNSKKIFSILFLIIGCIIPFKKVYATHAAGADLQYRWISGRTYEVTVSFYRDCAGVGAPASISLNASSQSCGENQDYTLNLVAGSGQEITFPCRTQQTLCTNSGSAFSGYEQYFYTNNITLPQNCSDWVFSFFVCCRNCAITTLNNPCTENLYVEATLNNIVAPTNSSPKFTNIPVAFICINQSFTYNHGVIDPDGDSLSYSFITPKTFNTTTFTVGNVSFKPGYSPTQPLTSSPAVTIDPGNGDIVMNPTANGEIGVTAILISEYRNGVLIGSVIRDMQFLTRVCNPNFLPSATGINGTAVFDTTMCPGSPISFFVNSNDANATDTVTMLWNNAIGGATFSTNAALNPQGTFSWTPTLADARTQPYSFIVTVRDNACPLEGSQTYSYSILVPKITATVSSPAFNGFNIACRSASTGSATVVASGGGSPYTYSWNPSGQTTPTATNLAAGIYTATVTEGHGCTTTAIDTLIQPTAIVSFSVLSASNVSCNGGNDGTVSISGAGGVSPYSYSWSNGQTTATATGLTANSFTVTVTDQNACTAQQSFLITQPTALNASVTSFQNVSCLGNANGKINTTVNGGTPPYTHHWSNGDTTANVTGLAPATYKDTVRDSKGCVQILSQVISQPGSAVSLPSSSVSSTNVSCFGLSNGTANVNPTGGTLPYTVTWSNGDIGNSADSLSVGNYSVHIVDGNGCTFDSIIPITQPAKLLATFVNYSVTPSGKNIGCNGDSTGKVKISPSGGTTPYTYSWSTGATIDSIKNVPAGTYIVHTTDAKGCMRSDTTVLTQPTLLNDSLLIHNVGCKGESSGGIRAVTYGGSPSYTYVWSNGAFPSDTVGDLFAGFYQVTITDTNGCQKIDTVTITEPNIIVPLILPATFIGAVNVKCNGDTSGSAVVNVFGGTSPFTYLWSQSGTDSFVTGLSAGPISVRIVDSNGCSIIRSTTLTEPAVLAPDTIYQNPLCYGDTSGYIALNMSGGTMPYTYNWSNSGNTDSIGHLSSGLYYSIVQDANNCLDSISVTLLDPDSLTANPATSNFQGFNGRCNGDSSSFIALHVTGGTGSYTFLWSNSSTNDSIGNLPGGNYSVTILDANGCRKDTTFILTQPPLLSDSIVLSIYNGSNVSCNGYIDGIAHSNASGGVPPYRYQWSNGDVLDSAVGLGAGNYSLTVTDSNGCSFTKPFTLVEPSPVSITSSISNFNGFGIGCFRDSTGCILISTSGGNSPYTYVWDTRDTINDSTLCNLPAGTFPVRIIDANGCQLDTFFVLNSPQPLADSTIVSAFGTYQIQCNGLNNGSIDVNVLGGVAPFNYTWSNGASSANLSGLSPGNYQVIIIDANSCKDTADFTLTEPTSITSVSITAGDVSCNGVDDGVAMANQVSGGVAPYLYSWSNNDTGLTANSLPVGKVILTVTDANLCIVGDTADLKYGDCILELPSAFSPNGDGINDFYVIHGINKYPQNTFKVFNRWGDEVYSKENYTNVDWFGQNMDGSNLPDGTYFVSFVAKGEDVKRNTFVDLRR